MDGQQNMDNQAIADAISADLKIIEDAEARVQKNLDATEDPFDDPKCNRRFKRLKRRWRRHASETKEWHGDAQECAEDGDSTTNFGGK